MDYQPNAKPHKAVYLTHPFAVTSGKVIVNCDDMDTVTTECVEISRHDGDKRLAFTCFHFSNSPLMQHNAAYELHMKRPHLKHAPACLTSGGKSFRQNIIKSLTIR